MMPNMMDSCFAMMSTQQRQGMVGVRREMLKSRVKISASRHLDVFSDEAIEEAKLSVV